MSRNLLFALLLTTGVVLVDTQHAAVQAQVKTEAAQGQPPAAQTKSEPAQAKPEAVQTKTEAAQTHTEPAQAKTDGAQAKTDEAQTQTEKTQAQTDEDGKLISVPGGKALGMSILGNQEAPTSLVIVPWKSSELGGSLGISPMLDDSRQPIDRDVFMRSLRYYEIRSGKKP
jgi:hypothetical protein